MSDIGESSPPPPLDKATLLRTRYSPEVFDELVTAYLSTGAGIAGMQPKIMVPERARVPIPSLIVKTGGPAYPDLASNEFLCLSAARTAGIAVPPFALSDDGRMLVLSLCCTPPQRRYLVQFVHQVGATRPVRWELRPDSDPPARH